MREIRTFDGALPRAGLHAAVTLMLDDELDISRGDMLVGAAGAPAIARASTRRCAGSATRRSTRGARTCCGTRRAKSRARIDRIDHLWNVSTQAREPAPARLAQNDIGRVALALAQPVFADRYADNRATGSFILIDETTNNTVAAGMVR